jgi:hypothetical protein
MSTEEKTEVLVITKKLSSNSKHHFSLSSDYSLCFPDTRIPEVTPCHSQNATTVSYSFYFTEKEDRVALIDGLILLATWSLLTEQH